MRNLRLSQVSITSISRDLEGLRQCAEPTVRQKRMAEAVFRKPKVLSALTQEFRATTCATIQLSWTRPRPALHLVSRREAESSVIEKMCGQCVRADA